MTEEKQPARLFSPKPTTKRKKTKKSLSKVPPPATAEPLPHRPSEELLEEPREVIPQPTPLREEPAKQADG